MGIEWFRDLSIAILGFVTLNETGLKEFFHDTGLSSDANEEEIAFLRKLRFKTKRPTPLYYYRELQNLRDPLHFRTH